MKAKIPRRRGRPRTEHEYEFAVALPSDPEERQALIAAGHAQLLELARMIGEELAEGELQSLPTAKYQKTKRTSATRWLRAALDKIDEVVAEEGLEPPTQGL